MTAQPAEALRQDQAPDVPAAERPALHVVDSLPASEVDDEVRTSALEEMMGVPPPGSEIFPNAIRAHCERLYDAHVETLFKQHWPDCPTADAAKLRFLTCNLYASAPYTVLFCSPNPPGIVKFATWLGGAMRLGQGGLHKGASLALKFFASSFPEEDHKRIVMIAAFIATIDHAFDHYMHDVEPKERGKMIRGLLEGTWAPDRPSLALTRAMQESFSAGVRDEDKEVFEGALERVKEWAESEVLGMTGVEDPKGLCWRTAGVEGTIDGLIFPVLRFAGEGARAWMYDVSLFVQMMDDWIDYPEDKKDVRKTPVITGDWNLGVLRKKWDDTVHGIEQLAAQAGMTSPEYQAFVRNAYVYMIHDVQKAMMHGLAA